MVNTNSLYTCSLFYVKKAWLKKKEISLANSSQKLIADSLIDKSLNFNWMSSALPLFLSYSIGCNCRFVRWNGRETIDIWPAEAMITWSTSGKEWLDKLLALLHSTFSSNLHSLNFVPIYCYKLDLEWLSNCLWSYSLWINSWLY